MNGVVVVPPLGGLHRATVIFAHGLGDSGHGWAASFKAHQLPGIKYVFPNASMMAVTFNGGMKMPAWYDVRGLDESAEEDALGIKNCAKTLSNLIETEMNLGLPSTRVLIGGFSQGGAIALYTGLTCKHSLGGIFALSAYLPLASDFPLLLENTNKKTRIFQAHGDKDDVVAYKWGLKSYEKLQSLQLDATFVTYRGLSHSSHEKEMREVTFFIKTQLE